MSKALNSERFCHITVSLLKCSDPAMNEHGGDLTPQFRKHGLMVKDLEEENPNLRLRRGNVFGKLWRSCRFTVRCVAKLCKVIKQFDIDVVDAHNGPGSFIGTIAAILTRRPRAVTEYQTRLPAPLPLWPLCARFYLTAADVVITDSAASAQVLRSWILRRTPVVNVIPNGIEPPRTDLTPAQAREMLGLPDDPRCKVIGQIATLQPHKGGMVLLEAARAVLALEPDAAFLLVGYANRNATYKNELAERARRLGIAERVRILTYPGWIGDVWAAIDIHVHASMLDSLPNSIIEAMSLGKPSIVTAVGGIPTLVEHERTGLLVPPGDVQSLADALLRLLRNADEARAFGDAACRRYGTRYRADIIARQFEDLFSAMSRSTHLLKRTLD